MPEIAFSRLALTSPISTRDLAKASLSLCRILAVNHTTKGSVAKMMSVSVSDTVDMTMNTPTSVTSEMNRSSGPWWESSEMSIRSLMMRDMIVPDLFSSKYENGSFCNLWNTVWRISPCKRLPIT